MRTWIRHPYGMFRRTWTNVGDNLYRRTRGKWLARCMTRIEPEDWRNYFS